MVKFCEPAIQQKLDTALVALDVDLTNKVFYLRAPDNEPGPFVIIQNGQRTVWRDINGPSGIAQCTLQIDAYHKTYLEAKTLASQIEDTLDGLREVVSWGSESPQETVDIRGVSLQNGVDIIDQTDIPLLYRESSSYLVTYKQ